MIVEGNCIACQIDVCVVKKETVVSRVCLQQQCPEDDEEQ